MDITSNKLHNDADFETFKRNVLSSYGLDLNAYKRPQMERRLRANMERCGARTFGQYYSLMTQDPALRDDFLDRITINVSELFRNPDQFEVLQTKVLPELLEKRHNLDVWSAGCSYGAEPYSLAILLDEFAPNGKHSILATDIDDRMLARAQKGVFEENEIRNVSKMRITRYFEALSGRFAAKEHLKRMISFRKNNMLDERRFPKGFDLIVCRNVVIYFTDETKSTLYHMFYNSLRPGGYMFVGGTERIIDYREIGFETRYPFFYRKPEKR